MSGTFKDGFICAAKGKGHLLWSRGKIKTLKLYVYLRCKGSRRVSSRAFELFEFTLKNGPIGESSSNYQQWVTCCQTCCHRVTVVVVKTDGGLLTSFPFSLNIAASFSGGLATACTFTTHKSVRCEDVLRLRHQLMPVFHFKCGRELDFISLHLLFIKNCLIYSSR